MTKICNLNYLLSYISRSSQITEKRNSTALTCRFKWIAFSYGVMLNHKRHDIILLSFSNSIYLLYVRGLTICGYWNHYSFLFTLLLNGCVFSSQHWSWWTCCACFNPTIPISLHFPRIKVNFVEYVILKLIKRYEQNLKQTWNGWNNSGGATTQQRILIPHLLNFYKNLSPNKLSWGLSWVQTWPWDIWLIFCSSISSHFFCSNQLIILQIR